MGLAVSENIAKIKIDSIIFDPSIYPRDLGQHPETEAEIDRFADLLMEGVSFPPVEVDQKCRLLDGYKRWKAHLKARRKEIAVIFCPVDSDYEAFLIACERNARHGMQFTRQERKAAAMRLYTEKCREKREFELLSEEDKKEIAMATGLSIRTIERETKELRDGIRERRNEVIYSHVEEKDLSLRKTASLMGLSPRGVSEVLKKKTQVSTYRQMSEATQGESGGVVLGEEGPSSEQLLKEMENFGMPSEIFQEKMARLESTVKTYKRVRSDIYDEVFALLEHVKDKDVIYGIYNMIAPLIQQDREYAKGFHSKVNLGENVENLAVHRSEAASH